MNMIITTSHTVDIMYKKHACIYDNISMQLIIMICT